MLGENLAPFENPSGIESSSPNTYVCALFDPSCRPIRLKRDETNYFTYFAPPLPDFILVFLSELSPTVLQGTFDVKIALESGQTTSRLLGTLSRKQRSLCADLQWTSKEKEIGKKVEEEDFDRFPNSRLETKMLDHCATTRVQGRLFKLSVTYDNIMDLASSENLEEVKQSPPQRKRKRHKEHSSPETDMLQSPVTKAHFPLKTDGQTTPKQVKNATSTGPSSRWGHTLTKLDQHSSLLLGGQGHKGQMSKDSLWLLDTEHQEWSPLVTVDSNKAERRMGHTCTYNSINNIIYVFGGSLKETWYKDIHCLDTKTWKWSHPKVTGMAPTRAYHSASLFQDELLIFGGVYPNPHPQPDGCSDQLVILNTETNSWYQPIVSGERPSPRSGHSANLINNQLYIFGGWDAPICNNDLFILDLGLMDFRKALTFGQQPPPRTWHSSIVSADFSKIIVFGGYDGNLAQSDLFALEIASLHWTSVTTSEAFPCPRAGHAMIRKCSKVDDKDTYLIFGGGDNESSFFNDLFEVQA